MATGRRFFSPEMARELKSLRERAGLSQGELARRMGLAGVDAKSYVSRLERGAINRPYLDTIVNYLHVCGARMSDFGMLLDRIEPLPEPRVPETQGSSPEQTLHVEVKVQREMANYQRKMQYPIRALPAPPAKQKRGAMKLREYRIQASMVEQAIRNYLSNALRSTMYFANYYNVGRQILGILRRYKEPKRSRKLDEVMALAEKKGLKAPVLAEVKRITIEQQRQVVVVPPADDVSPRGPSRRELEQELYALRARVIAETEKTVGQLPDVVKYHRVAAFHLLANQYMKKWFLARCMGMAPGPELRRLLAVMFDGVEKDQPAKNLDRELVRRVRSVVEQCLP
jgi:transcriptional regulator with XRE-family HTH domain